MNPPISISELSRRIRSVVENEFKFVFVTGEISNFKPHSSGHFYFSLKDEKSQIGAIMWSSKNAGLFFTPENGMKVTAKGRITLYESRGQYQIEVFELSPAGEGELQLAFDKLKQKLFSEGLFADEHKKPIPEFPERVGLITSETGAALQDFLNIARRRFPVTRIILLHSIVQGAAAAGSIIKSIKLANSPDLNLDVVVIARGGGSIEDLWCFNDERIAREIFKSAVPVVSAIGHEIDFTICDFVSDLRAPTPSAAAEMIFPEITDLNKSLNNYSIPLRTIVYSRIIFLKSMLDNISSNYYFKRPLDVINEFKFRLDDIDRKIKYTLDKNTLRLGETLNSYEKLLGTLDPQQILKRGFSIVVKGEHIISRKEMINKDDDVELKFYDGSKRATVK